MPKFATDIKQGKKLGEILPIDTADMGWNVFYDSSTRLLPIDDWDLLKHGEDETQFVPAWSIEALLQFLPVEVETDEAFIKNKFTLDIQKWEDGRVYVAYRFDVSKTFRFCSTTNSLVDSMFDAIMFLHKEGLLNTPKKKK